MVPGLTNACTITCFISRKLSCEDKKAFGWSLTLFVVVKLLLSDLKTLSSLIFVHAMLSLLSTL